MAGPRDPIGARGARASLHAVVLVTAACAGSAEPPPPPSLPPGLETAMYTSVLERVLLIDLFQDRDVAAICLGLGEELAPPPMDLMLRFMGGEPPLYPAGSCDRGADPATALPVIGLADGAPAALVVLTHRPARSGHLVEMRVERTGMRPMLVRCRVEVEGDAGRDPPVGGREVIGVRLRSC